MLADGVSLAHPGRLHTVASMLDNEIYDITIGTHKKYHQFIKGFKLEHLECISEQRFSNAIDKGFPMFNQAILEGYIKDDLKLIDKIKPDILIGDFRLSLLISSKLTHIPYINLTNAYWSDNLNIKYRVPDSNLTKTFGLKLGQYLFDFGRPFYFYFHARPFNVLLAKYELCEKNLSLGDIYTGGDHTIFLDDPTIFRDINLNYYQTVSGCINWSITGSRPIWLDNLPKNKPIVYINLGSSGSIDLLPEIVNRLKKLDLTIIVATLNKININPEPNVFVADYLDSLLIHELSDIFICNGGISAYPALSTGNYVICIPKNLDQFLNSQVLSDQKLATIVRSQSLEILDSTVSGLLGKEKQKHTLKYCDKETIVKIINQVS